MFQVPTKSPCMAYLPFFSSTIVCVPLTSIGEGALAADATETAATSEAAVRIAAHVLMLDILSLHCHATRAGRVRDTVDDRP